MPVRRRVAPEPGPALSPEPRQVVSPLLTVPEAAQYLKVSLREIRALKHHRVLKLVPHPIGEPYRKPWRFLRADLDRLIQEQVKLRDLRSNSR